MVKKTTPKGLQPILERQTVQDQVYAQLREALISGAFEAEETFTIAGLSERFRVSHMPVREALRRLVAQQGLEPLPNGTTRVPLITRERLADIRRTRLLIEGTAVEWAAPHLGAAQLDELDVLAREITAARRTREGVPVSLEKNRVFHFTLYQAAQSPVLMATIESLWLQSGAYLRATREFLHTEEQPADHLHEQCIAALRVGDAATARRHLEEDISWVFDRLDLDLQ